MNLSKYKNELLLLAAGFSVPFLLYGAFMGLALWCDLHNHPEATTPGDLPSFLPFFLYHGSIVGAVGLAFGILVLLTSRLLYNSRFKTEFACLVASFFIPFVLYGGFMAIAIWSDLDNHPEAIIPNELFGCFQVFLYSGAIAGSLGLVIGLIGLLLWKAISRLFKC
jgi:hypothetical protein